MRLTVKTSEEHYFRFLLEVLSAFKPFGELRGSQKDLLAQLLYYNHVYKDIPEEERFLLIFSPTIKKKIVKKLNLTAANIANNLSLLRQAGFIIENKIPKNYLFKYKGDVNIKFE